MIVIPTLDIVIVNWNAGPLLGACLASITGAQAPGFSLERVIVIDNDSDDESLEGIDALPLPLTLIRNPSNYGFAAGCNRGASESGADYLLFLNPDTRLFPSSLEKPIAFMQRPENADVGIAGIQLVDDAGKVWRSCARFPTVGRSIAMTLGLDRLLPRLFEPHFMVEWDHGDTREVEQVTGAFFLVRRDLFERLGAFDERFFVYYEDVDFSYRVFRAGFKNVFLADAQAYHKGGGTSAQAAGRRLFYNLDSRLRYAFKYFSPWNAVLVLLSSLTIEPVIRLGWAVGRWAVNEAVDTIVAYGMLYCRLPGLLRGLGRRP